MAINFPTSPSINDEYTYENKTWVWTGSAWRITPAQPFQTVSDSFTGDGSNTSFTLAATPASSDYTIVAVGGILQPKARYTVTGNTITFSSAVPANTPVDVSTLGGTGVSIVSAATVTTNAQPNITSVGTLTTLTVSGNVTANYLTGNGSQLSSITAANITGTIATASTVTTNAQPNITSVGTLTSLSLSGLISETFVTKTGATGTVDHDTTTASTFYHTSPAANFTANFTNVSTISNKAIVVVLIIVQGSTAYVPTTVQIDGSSQAVNWGGGSAPSGSANKIDIISYSLLRVGSSWTVLGSASSFG